MNKTIFIRAFLFMSCYFLSGYTVATTPMRKFVVYAYIPWANASNLLTYGIQPIDVIYEKNLFTNEKMDARKIKKLASEMSLKKTRLVSFDMEFGNRFKPETVIPTIRAVLKMFHNYNLTNPIGIYAVIPQNTYGVRPIGAFKYAYEKLNNNYSMLINDVDFISPSLYNYGISDYKVWLENASFNISIAKKMTSKPILPYISPIITVGSTVLVKDGHLVKELSEAEMAEKLSALYHLGASGCILWASSQDRTVEGQVPLFNPKKGWGKAVVDFVKCHPSKAS